MTNRRVKKKLIIKKGHTQLAHIFTSPIYLFSIFMFFNSSPILCPKFSQTFFIYFKNWNNNIDRPFGMHVVYEWLICSYKIIQCFTVDNSPISSRNENVEELNWWNFLLLVVTWAKKKSTVKSVKISKQKSFTWIIENRRFIIIFKRTAITNTCMSIVKQ